MPPDTSNKHDKEAIALWQDTELEAEARLLQETPVSRTFWESPTLAELTRAQNVKPVTGIQPMFGTWPGQENDSFEAASMPCGAALDMACGPTQTAI